MPTQFRQARRNQRWRMNRQMKDRRRVNVFLLEKRVSHLEGRQEVFVLDLENTQDLMTALELKVKDLLEREKARQAAEKWLAPVVGQPRQPNRFVRFWRGVAAMLNSKAEP